MVIIKMKDYNKGTFISFVQIMTLDRVLAILNARWNADIICKLALEKQEILPLACMDR